MIWKLTKYRKMCAQKYSVENWNHSKIKYKHRQNQKYQNSSYFVSLLEDYRFYLFIHSSNVTAFTAFIKNSTLLQQITQHIFIPIYIMLHMTEISLYLYFFFVIILILLLNSDYTIFAAASAGSYVLFYYYKNQHR